METMRNPQLRKKKEVSVSCCLGAELHHLSQMDQIWEKENPIFTENITKQKSSCCHFSCTCNCIVKAQRDTKPAGFGCQCVCFWIIVLLKDPNLTQIHFTDGFSEVLDPSMN